MPRSVLPVYQVILVVLIVIGIGTIIFLYHTDFVPVLILLLFIILAFQLLYSEAARGTRATPPRIRRNEPESLAGTVPGLATVTVTRCPVSGTISSHIFYGPPGGFSLGPFVNADSFRDLFLDHASDYNDAFSSSGPSSRPPPYSEASGSMHVNVHTATSVTSSYAGSSRDSLKDDEPPPPYEEAVSQL